MFKYILLILLTNLSFATERVVILDTGLNLEDPRFVQLLCKDVQGIDFTGEGINDYTGHGTHVAGIIKKYAIDSDYCFTIIKYYSEDVSGEQNTINVNKALEWIHYYYTPVVNFSSGGKNWNDDEYKNIKNTPETTFIVAAGNDGINLNKNCNYYPVCYKLPNIIRIGSLNVNGKRANSSNYGNIINFYEIGENVISTLPDGDIGFMSGTSMATAIFTGKFIYAKNHPSCKYHPQPSYCPYY